MNSQQYNNNFPTLGNNQMEKSLPGALQLGAFEPVVLKHPIPESVNQENSQSTIDSIPQYGISFKIGKKEYQFNPNEKMYSEFEYLLPDFIRPSFETYGEKKKMNILANIFIPGLNSFYEEQGDDIWNLHIKYCLQRRYKLPTAQLGTQYQKAISNVTQDRFAQKYPFNVQNLKLATFGKKILKICEVPEERVPKKYTADTVEAIICYFYNNDNSAGKKNFNDWFEECVIKSLDWNYIEKQENKSILNLILQNLYSEKKESNEVRILKSLFFDFSILEKGDRHKLRIRLLHPDVANKGNIAPKQAKLPQHLFPTVPGTGKRITHYNVKWAQDIPSDGAYISISSSDETMKKYLSKLDDKIDWIHNLKENNKIRDFLDAEIYKDSDNNERIVFRHGVTSTTRYSTNLLTLVAPEIEKYKDKVASLNKELKNINKNSNQNAWFKKKNEIDKWKVPGLATELRLTIPAGCFVTRPYIETDNKKRKIKGLIKDKNDTVVYCDTIKPNQVFAHVYLPKQIIYGIGSGSNIDDCMEGAVYNILSHHGKNLQRRTGINKDLTPAQLKNRFKKSNDIKKKKKEWFLNQSEKNFSMELKIPEKKDFRKNTNRKGNGNGNRKNNNNNNNGNGNKYNNNRRGKGGRRTY